MNELLQSEPIRFGLIGLAAILIMLIVRGLSSRGEK